MSQTLEAMKQYLQEAAYKTRVRMGDLISEVHCRKHLRERVKIEGETIYAGFTIVTGLEPAPNEEPCFECKHNPPAPVSRTPSRGGPGFFE